MSEETRTGMPESVFPQDGPTPRWRSFPVSATESREVLGIVARIDQELLKSKAGHGFMARGPWVRNFRREFKKLSGKSLLAYVAELRLERIRGLLLDSDKTVALIAGLVGYDDGNYFARQFRRLKGRSPKKSREK